MPHTIKAENEVLLQHTPVRPGPKQQKRYYEGVLLEPNLYPVTNRPGKWRYRVNRNDFVYFSGTVKQANRRAKMRNAPYSPRKWTTRRVIEEARKYATRDEFFWGSPAAHSAARKLGILNAACTHMERKADFAVDQMAFCYYARVERYGITAWKVGATSQSLDKRFRTEFKYVTILNVWPCQNGSEAMDMETEILLEHRKHAYDGRKLLEKGGTEMFSRDVLGLDREHRLAQ